MGWGWGDGDDPLVTILAEKVKVVGAEKSAWLERCRLGGSPESEMGKGGGGRRQGRVKGNGGCRIMRLGCSFRSSVYGL